MNTDAKCKLAMREFCTVPGTEGVDLRSGQLTRLSATQKASDVSVIPSTKTVYNWVDAGFLVGTSTCCSVRLKGKRERVRKRSGRSIDERPDCINQRNNLRIRMRRHRQKQEGHLLTLVERSISYGIVWMPKTGERTRS